VDYLQKEKLITKLYLKPHTASVNQRPYRCSYYQKLELDKIIEELLKIEVIQPSTSPYSSHALLVKKKDENWRLCVDYKWLNKLTDKNRYLVPIIDDLIEQIKGAN
jgi:hypothetical protein